jgi:catechol 2,3-dioxygenase-like lactoylglutathione lyase family enzyme
MKAKFAYTGIRVRDVEESVRFYTGVLGMREMGRSTIAEAGGTVVSLVSEDGGFPLELNHYAKGSRFDTAFEAGEAMDHLAFQVENLDKARSKPRRRATHPPWR